MRKGHRGTRLLAALGIVGAMAAPGCDSGTTKGDHTVFFVGYAYDGATGERLAKADLTDVSILYRDKTIAFTVEADGRFVSTEPLPTWQDYMVTIKTTAYRPFVSRNAGFDVPASLAMTDGVASASTTQTFSFDAYLFPKSLKAPKATLTVSVLDDLTGQPVLNKAAGTARFRPLAISSVQVGAKDTAAGAPRASRRVWANDEDLLTQTLTKAFKDGKIEIADAELPYGVSFEVSIYDVPGYQPFVTDGTSANTLPLLAGSVTSRTIALTRLSRDPLKLVSSSANVCTPPAPTAMTPGAQIQLTFSEDVDIVGTTYLEDVDNGLAIQSPTFGCTLRLSPDPAKQERGTKVEISGPTITFSFIPSVGITDSMGGMICAPLTTITSVSYGNLGQIVVQPKIDASRKVLLSTLLQQLNPMAVSTSLVCPSR